MTKPACFLLIKTNLDARQCVNFVKQSSLVVWADNVFGPYQIVAYIQAETLKEITSYVESLRAQKYINELDARMCKPIPGDDELKLFNVSKNQSAVLLINVNYKEEKERNVTYNLRKINGIVYARAMWGPTDIVAIIEAGDPEAMRNLICDEVKVSKGVATNTTLYCYSE